MSKKDWVSIPEFAKRIGKTPQYIRKLVKSGKIEKSATRPRGKRVEIDINQAVEQLENNTSYVNKKQPVKQIGNETKKTKPKRKKEPTPEEQQETIEAAGLKMLNLTEAQTLKANYDAALKKLEYEAKRRDLLPAGEVEKQVSDMVITARGKILAIKGLLAPLLKEFIEDPENFGLVMDNVETALRDTLTEMADSAKQ
ncbi:MAG: hypothetical protein JEZ12_27190 [Desulfobacterium sp.]|nr:hypothetical protein [Desulfobacterium sp.]